MRLTARHDTTPTDDVCARGHYSASSAVELDGVVYMLGSGTTDDVTIVKDRDSGTHYVVTVNPAHGYVVIGELDPHGYTVTEVDTGRPVVRETTLHNDQNASDHELELRPMTLIRRHVAAY